MTEYVLISKSTKDSETEHLVISNSAMQIIFGLRFRVVYPPFGQCCHCPTIKHSVYTDQVYAVVIACI